MAIEFAQDRAGSARIRTRRLLETVGWPERFTFAFAALLFIVCATLVVNPASVGPFFYYGVLWTGLVLVLHRREALNFGLAYVVNSTFIAIFFLVQTAVYPDSYGTTSPLGSWTDDSYFYTLAADKIPANLEVRDFYYLYTHTYTTLIRVLTPFSIEHPLDVVFFQSGIAAMLATFSRRYVYQLSSNGRLAKTVFVLTLVCPFLMMNGGVIMLRDTFAAALFIYSLSCIESKQRLLALVAIGFHIVLRPGTGLILLPAYAIVYFPEFKALVRRFFVPMAVLLFVLVLGAMRVLEDPPDVINMVTGTSEGGGLSFLGREILDGLTADPDANVFFLSLQELPFAVKFFLNGAYIFIYPFLGLKQAFAGDFFDLRAITMNLIAPVYALWLNAWFIAGAITKVRVTERQKAVVIAVLFSILLIGTYSLQTRHKLIIYPLYYFVVAIGYVSATPRERRIGYIVSSGLLLLQLAFALR